MSIPGHLNVIMMTKEDMDLLIATITTTDGTITMTEDIRNTTIETTDVKINTETTMMTDATTAAKDVKIITIVIMTKK